LVTIEAASASSRGWRGKLGIDPSNRTMIAHM
jgi:hypothetical protein